MIARLLQKLYFRMHDFSPNQFTNKHPRYKKYEIGDWTYGFPTVFDWNEGSTLVVGKFCSIGRDVKIYLGGEHRLDWLSTYPFREFMKGAEQTPRHSFTKGDVVIENDVWIGVDATILSGITLANGCVVGAGSVVTKSVPPYAVVAGNPARIIKYRFDQETIEKLLEMEWWNWPVEKIKNNLDNLCRPEIASLIENIV